MLKDAALPGMRPRLILPPEDMAVHTVLPGETARELSVGMGESAFRRVNGLWGPLLPGMQVLVCRAREKEAWRTAVERG